MITRFARAFVLVLLTALVLACSGCSWAESACTKALPALTTMTVLLDDAQDRLAQVEAIVVKIPDPATREKALAVVAELRAGLVAAEALAHAAATSCTAPDVSTVFAAFITAWPKIAPFIALLGGEGGSQVQAPLVMRYAR